MKVFFIILCFLFNNKIFSLSVHDIIPVTESAPPLVYLGESGEAEGVVSERVNILLKRLGVKKKIEILPWVRAYNIALKTDGAMIFGLGKNPERDKLFKYAGVVFNVYPYLYKLKTRKDIHVKNLEDAKKYQIGVVREDIKQKVLDNLGFKNLEVATSHELNFKKFIGNREDLIASSEIMLKTQLKEANLSYDIVEKVYKLKEIDSNRYLAFKKDTPDEIVNIVKKTIESIYTPEN